MSAKHTSGPWANDGGDITGIEDDPANGCVGPVDVAHVYLRTVPGRHEANARLIAAAPALLDALECLLNALPSATTHPAIHQARAALAKATGDA